MPAQDLELIGDCNAHVKQADSETELLLPPRMLGLDCIQQGTLWSLAFERLLWYLFRHL